MPNDETITRDSRVLRAAAEIVGRKVAAILASDKREADGYTVRVLTHSAAHYALDALMLEGRISPRERSCFVQADD